MKFRLGIDNQEISGYTLISPIKGQNPISLSDWIDDGEANEIIVDNILEFVPVEQLMPFIKALVSKLKRGGTATIVSNDINILCEKFIRGELNVIQFNKIIFGEKNFAWNFRLSAVSLADINDICKLLQVNILERRLNDYQFIIKVERVQ